MVAGAYTFKADTQPIRGLIRDASGLSLSNKSILGYQNRASKGDQSRERECTPGGSPKYARNRSILDEENMLSLGARMIEINAGDRLLKDYKERTSNFSNL